MFVHCRGKRAQHVPPHSTPKKPRVNGVQEGSSDTPPAANMGSPFVPVDVMVCANDDSDTDDDLLILETASTPKPKQPVLNPNIVKAEKDESEIHATMLLECSDDAAMDVTSETTAEVSAPVATSHPPDTVNTTTQTNVSIVKQEEDQNKSQGKQSAALSASSNGVAEQNSGL